MTGVKDLVLQQLGTGQFLIEKFTADLTDAEYFKVPTPGANHAAWIVGHIACSEDSIVAAITGAAQRLPDAMHELFKGGSKCVADAARYPARRQIDDLFRNARAHTVDVLQKFDEKRWDAPSPEGWDENLFPTLGTMWALQATHPFWHIGQLTVCRTALAKKHVLM